MSELFSQLGVEPVALLWQTLNFAIVLVAMFYLVYRPLTKLVIERTNRIAQGLTDAEAAKTELARADHVYAEKIAVAEREGTAIVKQSESTAKERAAVIVNDGEARGAALIAEARTLAERVKASELAALEREAKSFVEAVVQKTVGLAPDAIDAALVDQAVKTLAAKRA